jgi:transcriptional antiterminator RfaH
MDEREVMEPAWYCIRSHPKHERMAAAHLSRVAGVEVFNPRLRLVRCTARGRMWTTEPLFPNYLFARFVIEVTLEKVRYTPSVSKVLSFGDRIPRVPDSVIVDLRQNLEGKEQRVFADAPLKGEEVEIVAGPFEGAHGVVTRVLPAKQRVQVLMDVLGHSAVTEVTLGSVLFEKRRAAEFVLSDTNALATV